MINITTKVPIIGIYKITSPSGKIYIGQSIDIHKRWKYYSFPNSLKFQIKLKRSLIKYGTDAHQFDVIEECELEQLHKKETYWKYHYLNQFGWSQMLFCELYDRGGGPKSEETKRKISEKAKGHKRNLGNKQSQETKNKRNASLKGRIVTWKVGRPKGYKVSEESKDKVRKPRPESVKQNMRKPRTEQAKQNMRVPKPNLQIKVNQYDLEGNFIKTWDSITEIYNFFSKGINGSAITCCCKGRQKTAYGFIWEYK